MRIENTEVGDVLYGVLPHQDGWETHYCVVIAISEKHRKVRIAVGTSRGVPLSDDGLRPTEAVIRLSPKFSATGLKKATRFNLADHRFWISEDVLNRLERVGTIIGLEPVIRSFLRATRAADSL